MSRCGACSTVGAELCQCGAQASDCIDVDGSGAVGDPFVWDIILDPDSDNILTCGVNGLMATIPDVVLNPPRGRVTRTSNQAISSGVETAVTWPTESYDTDSMHAGGSSDLVVVTPGVYHFSGYVSFEASTAGTYRNFYITTATSIARQEQGPLTGLSSLCSLSVAGDFRMGIGDTVSAHVKHDAGTPINVTGGALSWHYIGT